jgi:hypothetical protein
VQRLPSVLVRHAEDRNETTDLRPSYEQTTRYIRLHTQYRTIAIHNKQHKQPHTRNKTGLKRAVRLRNHTIHLRMPIKLLSRMDRRQTATTATRRVSPKQNNSNRSPNPESPPPPPPPQPPLPPPPRKIPPTSDKPSFAHSNKYFPVNKHFQDGIRFAMEHTHDVSTKAISEAVINHWGDLLLVSLNDHYNQLTQIELAYQEQDAAESDLNARTRRVQNKLIRTCPARNHIYRRFTRYDRIVETRLRR